jgi:hypothetical protein
MNDQNQAAVVSRCCSDPSGSAITHQCNSFVPGLVTILENEPRHVVDEGVCHVARASCSE